MSAAYNTFGMFAQLMSLDFKFLNSLQTNTECFNTNYKIPLYLSKQIYNQSSRYYRQAALQMISLLDTILNCF